MEVGGNMGSVGTPQNWVPYENVRDCSQGFCSLYCPQWCYIIFPPPPPFGFSDGDSSGTNFSPLVIAIIGILAGAFLLVSYYTVISKYCGNLGSSNTRSTNSDPNNNNDSNENNQDQSNQEPWQIPNTGLDEALIKTITVCKYTKGDGFIDGTDCSVCLSEFQENESLRLLPNCSHAFHLSCIDTWLKSHANCPLCRANILCTSPLPLPSIQDTSPQVCENGEELQRRIASRSVTSSASTGTPGDSQENNSDTIIEVRDEGAQQIRSISMGMSRDRLSVADILCVNQDELYHYDSHITEEHGGSQECIESSSRKLNLGSTTNKSIHTRSKVLHCVMSPVTMKRSTSGGRFLFSNKHGRSSSRNLDIPL